MFVVIFANGELVPTLQLQELLKQADLVIAADGGAHHCERLGITPDVLIGDFDSIDPAVLRKFKESGVEIHAYPPRKDATDLELALDLAKDKAADTIWLLGGLGRRWDMSLTNILLGTSPKYKAMPINLLGEDCAIQILHPGKTNSVSGSTGCKISLLPVLGDARGVTLSGFEYPLDNHTIGVGSTLGVSNVMQGDRASIQFTEGILLCVQQFPS